MKESIRPGLDEFLGEAHLGRACAKALDLEPFPLESREGLGAAVEWTDEVELGVAHLAGEGFERDYILVHLVGFLIEAELAADLARTGDDHEWAALRAAGHARRITEPPDWLGADAPRSPGRK